MRILQVISSFPPACSYGGPARVAYEISRNLVAKGHQVTVCTTDAYDKNERQSKDLGMREESGLEVLNFRNISNTLAYKNFPFSLDLVRFLKKRVGEFDVVHLHEFRSLHAIAASNYAYRAGIPVVLQAHGGSARVWRMRAYKKVFDELFGQRILSRARILVAVSGMEVSQYASFGIDVSKIRVVPNGINLDEFTSAGSRKEFRQKHGMPENARIILYVGRLHPQKGLNYLVDAFKIVSGLYDDTRLVFIGPDAGMRDILQRKVELADLDHKVFFLGETSKVAEAYASSDLLVYPSQFEIFGLVPFEAIACGIPVVVSSDSGCGKLVEEAGCGLMVQYGDFNKLASCIITILESPTEAKLMVKRGQTYVHDNLTWSTIVKKLENIYSESLTY